MCCFSLFIAGVVLPQSPFEAWANGIGIDVPLLIGQFINSFQNISIRPKTELTVYIQNLVQLLSLFNQKIGTYNNNTQDFTVYL